MVKAVVLVAGKGKRMRPMTKYVAKSLIQVNDRPFLAYLLDEMIEAGIDDFIFIAGYKADQIKRFLEQYYFKEAKVKYSLVMQEQQLGTAHAIGLSEDLIGDEPFIVAMGDNLIGSEDFRDFVELIRKGVKDYYVKALEHPEPWHYGVFVVKELNNEMLLLDIEEKPEKPKSNLINTGLYLFHPDIFKIIKELKPSKRGEYEITDAIKILAKQGKVKVLRIKSYWHDFGRIEDIAKLEGFLTIRKEKEERQINKSLKG